ncbi:MAG: hypothetical protein HPZ79_00825 [Oscillospiraceae bacterium]|nr:hypothetical protein [Oscillospiraceae bacterium]
MTSRTECFDTQRKPELPKPYLLPIEWIGAFFMLMPVGGHVEKINCEGLEPPYLMLQNHASFVDFPMAARAMFPNSSGWVISIEEFVGREWLIRSIGGIYKRKFTADLTVVKHILTMLTKMNCSVTMFPEARYSLAGVNEQIDGALGKLAKKAKCPVVMHMQYGNFLRSPQWCKRPYRKVPVSSEFRQIVTREEVQTLSAAEIQRRIEDAFHYDDYQWQYDNRIEITSPYRAHNIHRILYQCPHCGTEFQMNSDHTQLWCEHCGTRWEMDTLGRLHCLNGEERFAHVPDWYRWERENVRREVQEGRYAFEDTVRLERMVSAHAGFEVLGNVTLTHNADGFRMEGTLASGEPFSFHRSPASMMSCHIEYDFKGRGDAIDLATLHDTYFVFPQTAHNVLTKLHFATEELHKAQQGQQVHKIQS